METAYPLILLGLGVITLFVLILWLRVNAFLGLIIAALLVGVLSPKVIFTEAVAGYRDLNLLNALDRVAYHFGDTMMKIGITIALATIIGKALMDSGAADRIVRAFVSLFGEKRASLALLFSGFVLSIPVFFDTVFFLLVPLAKALYARTRKNYLFYIMAIGAGGAITHSLVPPTPGPIGMAEKINVDLGMVILVGIVVGLPLAFVGYLYGKWIDRVNPVPLREVGDVSVEDLEKAALRPVDELPSLFWSVIPILLPVLLITSFTVFKTIVPGEPGFNLGDIWISSKSILGFIGHKTIALLIATVIAMWVVIRQKNMDRQQTSDFTTSALSEAAMILLITSAGGAFGGILKDIQVGESLKKISGDSVSPLVMCWGIAVLFKIAQGSGTVSMLTTSSIALTLLPATVLDSNGVPILSSVSQHLGYHPVYLVMAIGAGSLVGSWMNDSGFWVVAKMGGLTEKEALKSWTMNLAIMGIAGLPFIWLLTKILPLA